MITLDLIKQKWPNFTVLEEKVEAYKFDEIPTRYGPPLISIDPQNLRHLIIPVGEDYYMIEDRLSSGVQIQLNKWGISGIYHTYIDVVCRKPHLNDLFDVVILDILKSLEVDPSSLDRACRKVINKWRDLLSREPSSIPDRTVVIGLFGELWVLKKLTQFNVNAVNFWTGPEGSRFDFISQNYCLEVKTSSQKKLRLITINGHDQLEPYNEIPLHLAVLKVEELPASGETLQGLINSLISVGSDQEKLQTKLFKLGITSAIINQLNDTHFKIKEERIYIVDSNFPSITSSSFINGAVPNGIVNLTYQIDLTAEPPTPLNEVEKDIYYQHFCM